MKTNFKIFNLILFNLIIFILINLQSSNAQMFWNQACQFAGTSSSYLVVPNSSSINITANFTLEAWVNPSNSGTMGVVSKGGPRGGSLVYGLRVSANRFLLATNGAMRLISKTSTVLPINKWSHIAATYNTSANLFNLYLNGVLDTFSFIAGAIPASNTDSLFIGISGLTTPFNGQIDEIRLWNRDLTPTEVSQYFRTSLVVKTGIYSGLVMSLPFQSNNGSGGFTLSDISGNGNNAINRGASGVAQFNRPYATIMPNESVEFHGSNDYLAAPDDNILSPTSAVTLEAWIFPRTSNPFTIINKGNYRLEYFNVVQFVINGIVFGTGTGLAANQWSHVALSYSGSTGIYSFYLNGILKSTSNTGQGNIINGTDSLYIGGGPGSSALNGYIDEVRISHYVKSQSDINKFLYQSIDASNEPEPSIPEAVYPLNGYASSGVDGGPILSFRNNARFSHPGGIANQPVSPLNRNDNSNFTEAYYMSTSNKKIPASGTSGNISDSTTVSLNATITDINLFVALNHTNSSNLEIVLVGPNNDSVKVFDSKVTNSLDDNVITIFNDQADSSLLNNRYAAFSPIIKPENNINATFSGDNAQGKWKLIVRDESANDTGFLYAWGIQINNLTQRPKNLNLGVLIQGFYNASVNHMVPDTMRVYLRNAISPFAIVDSSKAVLNNIGSGILGFASVNNNQQYYIQLKHRNSIETWSSQTFDFTNDEASYPFFAFAHLAFGNNQIQVDNSPLKFAIYGGDVNQDGSVDATDLSVIDNDAFNFVTGYVRTDLTGENVVDASDAAIADNNAFNFVTKITP